MPLFRLGELLKAVPVFRRTVEDLHRRAAEGICRKSAERREAFVADVRRKQEHTNEWEGGWDALNADGERVEKRTGEKTRGGESRKS